jgi:hypothetical protein
MPAAPRQHDKATKIFFKVMGMPQSFKFAKSALKKESREIIRAQNTFWK